MISESLEDSSIKHIEYIIKRRQSSYIQLSLHTYKKFAQKRWILKKVENDQQTKKQKKTRKRS